MLLHIPCFFCNSNCKGSVCIAGGPRFGRVLSMECMDKIHGIAEVGHSSGP
jgi:hypothetical protein